MTLENWLKDKWLKKHSTSPKEINDILGMVERDIKDALNENISADWRLSIAFNASLQCANTALYASGFRTAGEGHHERVINSLKFTMNASEDLINQLNRFRNKRIKATYDMAGAISDQEVAEAIKFARSLFDQVKKWLQKNHPELYK